jgi:hypothetical protein
MPYGGNPGELMLPGWSRTCPPRDANDTEGADPAALRLRTGGSVDMFLTYYRYTPPGLTPR